MTYLKITLIVLGLALSLIGSFVASNLPFHKAFKLLRGWGTGTTEEWEPVTKDFKLISLNSNLCLVLGTLLQILGSTLTF